MIEYIVVSYIAMLLLVLARGRNYTGFKMFLLSPLLMPVFALGYLLKVVAWSVK